MITKYQEPNGPLKRQRTNNIVSNVINKIVTDTNKQIFFNQLLYNAFRKDIEKRKKREQSPSVPSIEEEMYPEIYRLFKPKKADLLEVRPFQKVKDVIKYQNPASPLNQRFTKEQEDNIKEIESSFTGGVKLSERGKQKMLGLLPEEKQYAPDTGMFKKFRDRTELFLNDVKNNKGVTINNNLFNYPHRYGIKVNPNFNYTTPDKINHKVESFSVKIPKKGKPTISGIEDGENIKYKWSNPQSKYIRDYINSFVENNY